MEQFTIDGKTVTAYQDKDLKKIESAFNCAAVRWRDACQKYFDAGKPDGERVSGAGIGVYYLPRRRQSPKFRIIIPAEKVCTNYGSLPWEMTKDVPLSYLESRGVDAQYEHGTAA